MHGRGTNGELSSSRKMKKLDSFTLALLEAVILSCGTFYFSHPSHNSCVISFSFLCYILGNTLIFAFAQPPFFLVFHFSSAFALFLSGHLRFGDPARSLPLVCFRSTFFFSLLSHSLLLGRYLF